MPLGSNFHIEPIDDEDEGGNTIPAGVFVNELTSARYRDKFIGTPFHKFVPARVTLA